MDRNDAVIGSEASRSLGSRPSLRNRIIVAAAMAVICGLISRLLAERPVQDFYVWWLAARTLMSGGDPYKIAADWSGVGFLYPLPTAIATVPLMWLPVQIAGPLFVALECGALAFVVTRTAWWPLLMFASGSMFSAVTAAQWSPLMTLAILAPRATWLGVLKPNFGLAMWVARPSIRNAIVVLAILAMSVAFRPTWPREWLGVLATTKAHFAPWHTTGGFVLLAAWLRWRRPEARLLGVLSLLSSSPIAYDTLPLLTIARTRLEVMTLCVLSCGLLLATGYMTLAGQTEAYLRIARPATTWLMYVPALLMVLRRSNVGDVPGWLDLLHERARGLLRSALRA